jgi:hypothetical protein
LTAKYSSIEQAGHMRTIQKGTFGELLTKQAMRKNLYKKIYGYLRYFSLLLREVTFQIALVSCIFNNHLVKHSWMDAIQAWKIIELLT